MAPAHTRNVSWNFPMSSVPPPQRPSSSPLCIPKATFQTLCLPIVVSEAAYKESFALRDIQFVTCLINFSRLSRPSIFHRCCCTTSASSNILVLSSFAFSRVFCFFFFLFFLRPNNTCRTQYVAFKYSSVNFRCFHVHATRLEDVCQLLYTVSQFGSDIDKFRFKDRLRKAKKKYLLAEFIIFRISLHGYRSPVRVYSYVKFSTFSDSIVSYFQITIWSVFPR